MSLTSYKYTVLFAMESEATPFLALGKIQVLEVGFPSASHFYSWRRGHNECLVVVAGRSRRHQCDRIGQVAAAVMAREALMVAPSSVLLSVGTCGAVNRSLRVGDVVVGAGRACFYDHRVPLVEFSRFADGDYPLLDVADVIAPQLPRVTIATGSSLDMSERDVANLSRLGADVKEMELAAIAQIASEYGGTCAAIKAVANSAGDSAHSEFNDNLGFVSQRLADVVAEVVSPRH